MKILHLYYDIMNLYGDYANVSAFERLMKALGKDVRTDRSSFRDKADLSEYDFLYIGSGTERNQKVVMKDMQRYKEDLRDCIDKGKVMLMTGNSFEMLGSSVTDSKGNVHEGLGLFSFSTTEQNKTRQTGDAVFSMKGTDKKFVGFINKCSSISGVDKPLFDIEMGLGNTDNEKTEGIRLGNFFGTHLTGPILVKNPWFLCYIASLVTGENINPSDELLKYELAGYDVTLSELNKRIGL